MMQQQEAAILGAPSDNAMQTVKVYDELTPRCHRKELENRTRDPVRCIHIVILSGNLQGVHNVVMPLNIVSELIYCLSNK